VIGIDAEFVQLEMEKASIREDGTRVVSKEGRQALARLSVLDAREDVVMMDDYVLPSEPVMDYLTRFSGLTREDLDPSLCRHHLVTARTAYLKLRYLIDRGVILVGHGLKKDFRIINVYVPPAQVIDTVDLWCLEGQRKISLRFLAAFLLKENIQGETHDSIEDARTALRLWRKWEEVRREGKVEQVLNALYEYGRKTGWKLQQEQEQEQEQQL
jgi:PAB-dependent poly(A)-specific ribonuclease subunit 2